MSAAAYITEVQTQSNGRRKMFCRECACVETAVLLCMIKRSVLIITSRHNDRRST